MHEGLKLYIKYTMKDIKACSFARVYSGALVKIKFSLVVFLVLAALFAILFTADLYSDEDRILLPIMLAFLFLLIVITFLPGILLYWTYINRNKDGGLLSILQCFDILDDRIIITSKKGSFALPWNDVYKIKELKPCFMIYSSPAKIFLIPRRCFESQEQLTLFIMILKDRVDRKKLKLKGYRLKKSMPDSGEPFDVEPPRQSEPTEQNEKDADNSGDHPILELRFSLAEKDLLSFNFRFYYTSPSGLIITAIGAFLLFGYIRRMVESGHNMIGALIIGLFFVLFSPLTIYLKMHNQFQKDAIYRKPFTYQFYRDYYQIDFSSGSSRFFWTDHVKIVESKKAFSFFITKQTAHVIPKRILNEQANELLLKSIVEKNRVKLK